GRVLENTARTYDQRRPLGGVDRGHRLAGVHQLEDAVLIAVDHHRALAAAPAPTSVTPDLLEAAKKEGTVVFYTSIELQTAEKIAKAFETAHPGIDVQVERNGCERIVQRIAQERSSNIHAADVVECSDMTALFTWKKEGWLASYVPADVAKYPADYRDPDGFYATDRLTLSPIEYNTKLVKPEDAPKSFADLLDPKWKGKIVKAHPGYSGTIMTATYQMQRDLGWTWFEQLAKQNIMQVQSSADPPKKLELGERAVMADGNEYNVFQIKEKGGPLEPVYAVEGSPLIIGPNGIFKSSPNPNAAKLFQSFCFSREAQQLIIDVGGLRSVHPQTQEKPGRKPFRDIKTMKDDAAAVEKEGDAIKARYSKLFRV
ncbi:MAG: extracellular solute-binding protein, partial [Bradyrhizobium sp.]